MKRKIKLYRVVLILSTLMFSLAFKSSHPIKMTSSLLEYDQETTLLKMECRVFIDDFENSINSTFNTKINVSNLSKKDKEAIEAYFEKKYVVVINDKKIPLKYKSSNVMIEHNVFAIKFSKDILAIKKGDQFYIENTLFYKEFNYLQSNQMMLRMPPFIDDKYFDARYNDYSLHFSL